jgi:hypothetical protein
MHARPQVKEILIAKELLRWVKIVRYNYIEARYPRARARRNF